jgi:LacI family transcriptional regulator
MEGGMRALRQLIALPIRPTAVLCSNDMTAIGVMREAYDQGISVPQELSVVGFDNIRLAEFMIPPLTTVDMSQTELARIAFKALVSDISRETPAEHGAEYQLNTNLVLRRSTALAQSGPLRNKATKT